MKSRDIQNCLSYLVFCDNLIRRNSMSPPKLSRNTPIPENTNMNCNIFSYTIYQSWHVFIVVVSILVFILKRSRDSLLYIKKETNHVLFIC